MTNRPLVTEGRTLSLTRAELDKALALRNLCKDKSSAAVRTEASAKLLIWLAAYYEDLLACADVAISMQGFDPALIQANNESQPKMDSFSDPRAFYVTPVMLECLLEAYYVAGPTRRVSASDYAFRAKLVYHGFIEPAGEITAWEYNGGIHEVQPFRCTVKGNAWVTCLLAINPKDL